MAYAAMDAALLDPTDSPMIYERAFDLIDYFANSVINECSNVPFVDPYWHDNLNDIGIADVANDLEIDDILVHPHNILKFAGTAGSIDSDGGTLRYRRLIKASHPEQAIWLLASDREFVKCIEERKTFHPIYESEKPKDRVVSYLNMQCKKKFD